MRAALLVAFVAGGISALVPKRLAVAVVIVAVLVVLLTLLEPLFGVWR